MKIKKMLTALFQKGLSLEVNNDKLRVKGNLSILSDAEKKFLSENKAEIISLVKDQSQEQVFISKQEQGEFKPLSFSQQSLWLLDKINNGSSHYNLSSAFKLKGKIDLAALNKTFLTILERHESLRSTFSVSDSGEPRQQVQSIEQFEITSEDFHSDNGREEDLLFKKIQEEAYKEFDLTKDILLRVLLLNLSDSEFILVVTMHHIASDGWSMALLINEFNTLYNSFRQGEEHPLTDLPIQYSDYASWQRNWMQGDVLEKYTTFWKKQLADLPVVHNLPLDKTRPVVQRFVGKTYRSLIDKNLLTKLYDFCHSESASLFMGIHAAFSSLLARYSNETDIVVGSPIANREKAETANLVGFFMNLLVLRSDLSERPGFRALIRQSKEMLEAAYQYQQMPFENLVDILNVNRTLSHNPLFQVLLTLQNNQQGNVSFSDLTMQTLEYDTARTAKYDLSLNITESENGLALDWEFNTDLFAEASIIRMADHFKTLLEAVLASPDENVFKINMIGEKDAKEIYQYLTGPSLEIDSKKHVVSYLKQQIKSKPEEVAVISNGISYNYKSFGEKVDTIAFALREQGVKSGDKVGLCLLRGIELVTGIFACFKIGATYIPLDPVYPAERLNQIIDDAQPKCIATLKPLSKQYLNKVSKESIVLLDQIEYTEETKTIRTSLDETQIAYIIFTSGTTGRPKGIEITHGNLNNLLAGFDASFATNDQQRWLAQTSINFDISVLELIWTISRGQTIVLQQSNPYKLLSPDWLAPAKPIDFSVMFFGADKRKDRKYELLMETARIADQNGFKAIWTPERHFGEFGGAFPNPSVMSAALAVATEQLQIRSGSVVLPLHDPVRVAEEWSIVDNLSKGRIGLSIASGWQPDDFVFSNTDYSNRHQIMRDRIEELKKLWKGESVIRKNGIGKDFSIKVRPKPVQEDLPIWITAGGNPKTFEYAGAIGANLLTHMLGQSQENLANNIAIYHQALRDNGHAIEDKKVTLMLHTFIDDSEQNALSISEQPFKDYLESSIKLMEPLAKQVGLDVHEQKEELINFAFNKFSKENTLIGSPESCQKMLLAIQQIGVTEVACLVDFGIEDEKVLEGLNKIAETKKLYQNGIAFNDLLDVENYKTELDLIDQFEITHVQMTPSQSKLVLDLHREKKDKSLSSVKHWFIGGEALNLDVVKGLTEITNCSFYNMYGPTETTVWSAWRKINAQDIHVGQPIANTSLLLLNEFEQQVPIGVVGELYIGGLGLAKGYHNNEALTTDRFKNISNTHFGNQIFYKTGDLMKLRTDGNFEYIGRKDNQVKVNGYRVELEEIEKNISQVSGVKNCKVVPISNNNVTSLSAYVVKEDIVHGSYVELPYEKQAKSFHFPDGSLIYHQSDRQLAMLHQEIIEDGIYFKHGISLSEDAVVLDLGANIGTFSIDVNQRYPGATVIAFEPIPQIFSALKKNFEHRKIKGRVLNYGVSNKKEKATFFYYPEMAGMSGRFADQETILSAVDQYISHDKKMVQEDMSTYQGKERDVVKSFYDQTSDNQEIDQYIASLYQAEEVECQLTTVSDIIDELEIKAIDLLKLDVEKSECLVLEGIRLEHWPMIRQLAVEVDGDFNLNIIMNLLTEKGYEVNVDELAMSDSTTQNEENTYMLYAINPKYGLLENDKVAQQIKSQASETVIRDYLKVQLPDYMNPANIHFVPTIPLMANGKVNMVELKEFKAEKKDSKVIPKLTNKTELKVYQVWCDVLEKENIPYHVSIFEAGGNSMKIVLLHERLQSEFKVNFSLVELFRNPTIQQQAKLIQNANSKESDTTKKAMDKGKMRRRARANRIK